MFKNNFPNLAVGSVEETLDYYTGVLGFEVDGTHPQAMPFLWAMAHRDDVSLMFEARQDGNAPEKPVSTVSFWIRVDKVRPLYESVRARTQLCADLHETFYGSTEFSVQDPNGFVLTFAEMKEAV